MSNKKRNKPYKGSVSTKPTITRVSAISRNPVHQWWVDHQKFAKPVGIAAGVAFVIILVIIGLISIIW